jgi:DNA-binding MarR family transcriptional regulator
LKRLVDAGWVEESEPRRLPDDHDERRRYYELSAAGRRALAEETARMEHLVRVARRRLA